MAPTGRFVLDSNIVIALLAGEQAVLGRIAAAETVYVPAIALGEHGELKATLRAKGTPLPENDVWIAAAARPRQTPATARAGALEGRLACFRNHPRSFGCLAAERRLQGGGPGTLLERTCR